MSKKNRKRRRSFMMYMQDTYKNKLTAIVLMAISIVPILLDHDATLLVVMVAFAGPLFFAKDNWIYYRLSRNGAFFLYIS